MTDILLEQTKDGGEITVINGSILFSKGGLETSVYLALFGGNEDDNGSEGNEKIWWGNAGELANDQYRSETQHLLQSIPAIPNNLLRIEEAINRDLAYLLNENIATSIDVIVSIVDLNRICIQLEINADSGLINLNFIENWKASL